MAKESAESDLSIRVPFEAQLGFSLVLIVWGVMSLTDIIEGQQIPPVVWFAVAAGLFGYAINRIRQS